MFKTALNQDLYTFTSLLGVSYYTFVRGMIEILTFRNETYCSQDVFDDVPHNDGILRPSTAVPTKSSLKPCPTSPKINYPALRAADAQNQDE